MVQALNHGSINTVIPGVYVAERVADADRVPPLKGILGIVGSFPELASGVAYRVRSDREMRNLAPGSNLMADYADVVFKPSPDGDVVAPLEVLLFSTMESEQATGTIAGDGGDAVDLFSYIWGPRGNTGVVTLGGSGETRSVSVTNSGRTRQTTYNTNANTLLLAYAYAGDDAGSSSEAVGFADDGAGDGTVLMNVDSIPGGLGRGIEVVFSRTLPVACILGNDNDSWKPYGPVSGVLTFVWDGTLTTATTLSARIDGLADDGATTETIVLDDNGPGATSGSEVSTKSWVRVDTVSIFTNTGGAGDYNTGDVVIQGRNFQPFSAETGFETPRDIITFMADYAADGFTASSGSPDVGTVPLADMDFATGVATATATAWALARAINSFGELVSATLPTIPYPVDFDAPASTYLTGGALGTTDVDAALAEMRWYNINVIASLVPTMGELAPHLEYMWATGANERQGWVSLPANTSVSAASSATLAVDSDKLSLIAQSGRWVDRASRTRTATPELVALNLAAMQCGVGPSVSINGKRPRVFDLVQAWAKDATEDAIRAGLTVISELPGDVPRVVRHITTKRTSDNPILTEGSARESCALFYRAVRNRVRSILNGVGKTTSTSAAAINGGVIDVCDTASDPATGYIQGYITSSVETKQEGVTFTIDASFYPSLPPLFALFRPTALVASVTVSAA